jgi:uracil-DNA glycosylase
MDPKSNYEDFHLLDEITLNDVFPSWKTILSEIEQSYFTSIESKINQDLIKFARHFSIFPAQKNIFEAFKYFELPETKCVIIGQDPYHQPKQAHGLSFSIANQDIPLPPSLRNIIKELESEYPSYKMSSGNLTNWAKQGVLLLNSALTVLESNANEHQSVWSPITTHIIKNLSSKHQGGCIFLLWGNEAKKYKKIIDQTKHHILEANHPSPLSANRGGWFGHQHFIKTNEILRECNKKEIEWCY